MMTIRQTKKRGSLRGTKILSVRFPDIFAASLVTPKKFSNAPLKPSSSIFKNAALMSAGGALAIRNANTKLNQRSFRGMISSVPKVGKSSGAIAVSAAE
jgi:hypothetical protein